MSTIHDQLRARRRALGLKQHDMPLKVGMTRQQYQRLEAGGNPRLTTLELVAAGLDLALMLVPKEKLSEVRAVLSEPQYSPPPLHRPPTTSDEISNPWDEIFKESKDD